MGKIKEALRLVLVRSFFINVLCPKFNERAPVSMKIIRFHVVIHLFIYSSAGGLHVIHEVCNVKYPGKCSESCMHYDPDALCPTCRRMGARGSSLGVHMGG